MEIDICTFEADTGSFHEEPNKKLPYRLCGNPKFVKNVAFNEKLAVYVPRKTRGAIMSVERREWLQTKLEKDGADLIALLNPQPERYVIKEGLDFCLLKQLLEKQNLHFALESIKELPTMKKSVERHAGIEQNTIRKWVESFFERLEENDQKEN